MRGHASARIDRARIPPTPQTHHLIGNRPSWR
jgi:hypothetical protein